MYEEAFNKFLKEYESKSKENQPECPTAEKI